MKFIDTEYFAVIDTETNFDNEVISVGVVIADSELYTPSDRLYLILDPEYRKPAMFSYALECSRASADAMVSRGEAVRRIKRLLNEYGVEKIFAYNANFDKGHLPELNGYRWYDIMRLASYRQFNSKIPPECQCCKTGKMKCGYGAEQIYIMLSEDTCYREIHNALTDAEDELEIMRLLGHGLETYEIAKL